MKPTRKKVNQTLDKIIKNAQDDDQKWGVTEAMQIMTKKVSQTTRTGEYNE